jgi:hypothetical protein
MVQMRWVTKYVVRNDDLVPTKVLQYRQQYDPTIYAGIPPHPATPYANNLNPMKWSEWEEVPITDITIT